MARGRLAARRQACGGVGQLARQHWMWGSTFLAAMSSIVPSTHCFVSKPETFTHT